MSNYNPQTDHLKATRWHKGESGNPKGKPKGTRHLSTWIQEIMEDEAFEQQLIDGTRFKGAPVKALVTALIIKALNGDVRAFDLIGKYGYGAKYPESKSISSEEPRPILGGISMNKYIK